MSSEKTAAPEIIVFGAAYRVVGPAHKDAATAQLLSSAKKVIIVPCYGMAPPQAQYKAKQLADVLEGRGAKV